MHHAEQLYPYLQVDRYLCDLIGARALASALETGLIDRLAGEPAMSFGVLSNAIDMNPRGLRFLVDLLKSAGIAAEDATGIRLTEEFRDVLQFRDLLEAKIGFIGTVLPDVLDHFTELVGAPQAFMANSRVFELFRYDRCFDVTPENVAATKRWVAYTTALTRYEAGACLANFDFSSCRRMLDIGGNSGEFVLRLCETLEELSATVFDLPVVCEIGREHVAGTPEAARINFVAGDVYGDRLPSGYDLVSFKSFLHDWPAEDAVAALRRATQALAPGGTLLIYERGEIEVGDETPSFAMIPNLLFLHFFRPAAFYADALRTIGLQDIDVRRVDLDMPFHLISARKP